MNYSPRNLTPEVIGHRVVPRNATYKHQAILWRRGWTEVRWMEFQANVQSSRMLTEEMQREEIRETRKMNQDEAKRREAADQFFREQDAKRLEAGLREADALEKIATVLSEQFYHNLNNPRG